MGKTHQLTKLYTKLQWSIFLVDDMVLVVNDPVAIDRAVHSTLYVHGGLLRGGRYVNDTYY